MQRLLNDVFRTSKNFHFQYVLPSFQRLGPSFLKRFKDVIGPLGSRHRYVAEILPIRRKVLNNQSINQFVDKLYRWIRYVQYILITMYNYKIL